MDCELSQHRPRAVRAGNDRRILNACGPPVSVWLDTPRGPGPGLVSLDITPADPWAPNWTVSATLGDDLPEGSIVNILWKPFSGTTDWRSVPAKPVGSSYQGTVAGGGQGAMFAVEILSGTGEGWRYPDILQETPYRALSPGSQ